MSFDIGRITAHLAEPDVKITTELIRLINVNIDPPSPLEEKDVFVRAMYVVSDEVNSFGGCFPADEHESLCRLLIDSPVMVGHRKDSLPIGRNFHAAVVERQGRLWVKSYFYWLRNAQGAETLKENIDGGIYKECSIGFTFLFPECSICGKDIRICEHQPLEHYGKDENEKVCHFNYRQIERVLETSLVYRGATPETSISKELQRTTTVVKIKADAQAKVEQVISSPVELDADCRYLVTPHYDGLPVLMTCSPEGTTISISDGTELSQTVSDRFTDRRLPEMNNAFGYLVGMRGRKRCSADQAQRFVEGKSSPVTRLEIRLFPQDDIQLPVDFPNKQRYAVRMLRSNTTDVAGIAPVARALSTRAGVRIWPEGKYPPEFSGYRYNPPIISDNHEEPHCESGYYTLKMSAETGRGQLSLTVKDSVTRFDIRQFNLARLAKGARFITDRSSESTTDIYNDELMAVSGPVLESITTEKAYSCKLDGSLKGVFFLQPIKLNDKERFLFYQQMA